MGDDLSYGLNTLGPLCLWQCFFKLNVMFKFGFATQEAVHSTLLVFSLLSSPMHWLALPKTRLKVKNKQRVKCIEYTLNCSNSLCYYFTGYFS